MKARIYYIYWKLFTWIERPTCCLIKKHLGRQELLSYQTFLADSGQILYPEGFSFRALYPYSYKDRRRQALKTFLWDMKGKYKIKENN